MDSLNSTCVFIGLKTRNWKQHFACFQFPSQIEFCKQFLFSVYFELPYKFFSLKNGKLVLKTKYKRKKQLQNIPLIFFKYFLNPYFEFFFFLTLYLSLALCVCAHNFLSRTTSLKNNFFLVFFVCGVLSLSLERKMTAFFSPRIEGKWYSRKQEENEYVIRSVAFTIFSQQLIDNKLLLVLI